MRMGAHDRAVDEHRTKLRVGAEVLQQPIPTLRLRPAAKPHERGVPVAQFGGQISPRCPGAQHPQDCLEEQPIVFGVLSRIAGLSRQHRFDERPLGVGQYTSVHPDRHPKNRM